MQSIQYASVPSSEKLLVRATLCFLGFAGHRQRLLGPAKTRTDSNLDAVQLSVNGMVLGTQSSTDHIFRWTGVSLAAGANTIEVTGTQDGTTYTDDVTWSAPGG